MSLTRLIIDSDLSSDGFKSVVNLAPLGLDGAISFQNYIGALCGGNEMASLTFQVGAVQATGTIVSTGTAGNNETMKILNETLTAKTSGAVPADGEFDISATPATQAANIALAINSVAALSGQVTAVAVEGTVTVTAVVPGIVGNGLELADVNLANVAVTGFSGGSDGTTYVLDLN